MVRGRWRARTLVVAAALAAATVVQAAPAGAAHQPGPSASAVAASKARVAALEKQVVAAAAKVARSRDALDRSRVDAEVAIEAYDKAQVQQASAASAVAAAQLVLGAATSRVASARRQVVRFAVAAYEGGTLSSLDALLNANGPDALLYRLGALDAVSRSQHDVVAALRGAEAYQRAVQQQAAAVLDRARRATAAAAAARTQAQRMAATQTAAVARLTSARHDLATMLRGARAHAGALERARLEALARARAEAAARRQAAQQAAQQAARQAAQQQTPPAVFPGPTGTTVSADTEQAALQQAESQIGKPYEWGAAGPDSYDCSGLVMWAYAQVGVHVDHWTGDQWNEGEHIAVADIRPGDLLFFATDTTDPNTIHHVGMYAGNGEMVEAPYTGANVRMSPAFRPDLIGVVRLFNR
jgi:cell wall-associated NlpC family hydrolase